MCAFLTTASDAGCGDCQVALHLARTGGLRILGIDALERHVAQAQARIAGAGGEGAGVTVRLGDYHELDWIADESLDGVYTSKCTGAREKEGREEE